MLVGGGVEDHARPVLARRPRASAPPRGSRPARRPRRARGGPPRARARSSNRLSSAWSSSTSCRGPTRAIWRHSSDPIDPPGAGDQHDLVVAGRRRRAPAPCAPARGRARPPPAARAPGASTGVPAGCSSSNTVGSVRTGMPRAAAGRHHPRAQRARRGRDRDEHLLGLGVVQHRAPARRCAPSTRRPCRRMAALARVVVDEADRPVAQRGIAHQLAQDLAAAAAGAHDQHVARVRAGAKPGAGSSASDTARRTPQVRPAVSRKNSAITPAGAATATSRPPTSTLTGCVSAM